MKKPKVSILMPTRNRAAFFEQALASARNQTYENLEIVVSDNASVDETPALAQKYAGDPRIRWNRNEENLGLDGNWRKLLYELATGDYVKILGDDDYIADPEHVSKAVALIEQGAQAVFAGAGVLYMGGDQIEDQSWRLPPLLEPAWWLDNFAQWRGKRVLFPDITTCSIFHRETAGKYGAFVNPVFGMDYELGLKFMLGGRTGYLSGIECVHRNHVFNDGRNAKLELVLTGFELFERVRRHALERGLPKPALDGFCRRGSFVFVSGFVVGAWARDRGVGPRSLRHFYKTLKAIDPTLARQVVLSPLVMGKLLLARSSGPYRYSREAYRKLREAAGVIDSYLAGTTQDRLDVR